jgi:protein phosphatase 2C family protein 2/3
MEDSHTVHLYLPPADAGYVAKHPADNIKQQPAGCTVSNDDEDDEGPALFGVFDGHGGSSAAKFAGTTMHSRLRALDSYSGFKKNGEGVELIRTEVGDYKDALKEAFLKTDEDLRAGP